MQASLAPAVGAVGRSRRGARGVRAGVAVGEDDGDPGRVQALGGLVDRVGGVEAPAAGHPERRVHDPHAELGVGEDVVVGDHREQDARPEAHRVADHAGAGGDPGVEARGLGAVARRDPGHVAAVAVVVPVAVLRHGRTALDGRARRRSPAPCGWRPCGRRGRGAARRRRSRRSRCSPRGRRSPAPPARPGARRTPRACPATARRRGGGRMGGHHVRRSGGGAQGGRGALSPRPSAGPSATGP